MRAFAAAALLAIASLLACRGGAPDDPSSESKQAASLPGVDTHEFTPRERSEFDRYTASLPAPCPGIAVAIAQCILEKRPCPACKTAALAIAKAVREGLAREQVEALYKQRFDATSTKQIPVDGSPVRGPETAAVTVVEFADFECPFCQHIAPELDELWQKRSTAVRFVYKFMPLSMHPRGEPAARAAIAAQAQGKFWDMHRVLFASAGRLEDGDLETYARSIGLDVERFKADMQAPATKARLDADRKLADDLGVKGTPTLFVNGREYDGRGASLDEWVDGEISGAGSK